MTQERRDVATLAYFAVLFLLQSITRFIPHQDSQSNIDNRAHNNFHDMVISVFLNLLDTAIQRAMFFECQFNVSLSSETMQPISTAFVV